VSLINITDIITATIAIILPAIQHAQ